MCFNGVNSTGLGYLALYLQPWSCAITKSSSSFQYTYRRRAISLCVIQGSKNACQICSTYKLHDEYLPHFAARDMS